MITQEQEYAVRQFIDCWNVSMPYPDIGSALNCIECNALLQLLYAFEEFDAGRALLEAHSGADEEGDDPDHLRIQEESCRKKSSSVSHTINQRKEKPHTRNDAVSNR